jgi:hypothetical protein
MSWMVCPRCHFSQTPVERCRRCGEPLTPSPDPEGPPAEPDRLAPANRSRWLAAAAVGIVLVAALWRVGRRGDTGPAAAAPGPEPTAGSLDLSGRWRASFSKMLGGNPPRPALKEISLESDRDGSIRAARVVLTDPGRGGAGAGYRSASDGGRRLTEALAALAAAPEGAPLALDFLELAGWIPEKPRLWRALEGAGPTGGTAAGAVPPRYVLVESLETDYLVQAGINESGFLSYAFFSPAYAPPRGRDELSRVIHPEPGASLRGFRDLVWDLGGAADFLKLELSVSISGPEGGAPDDVVLKREAPYKLTM